MRKIDLETARFNMVEQQVRTWDVLDQRILDLISRAPREDYVPPAYRNLAFVDMNIPLGQGQVMLSPKMEARLLQELDIRPVDSILEIGTGSGYMTSLLASLGKQVYSVDIFPEFTRQAAANLEQHGVHNVTLETGDAARGWDSHRPYDVIVITGSLPMLPDTFREDLALGGRLIAIVGVSPVMDVRLIQRLTEDGFTEHSLFETDLPPLVNAATPAKFVF